MIFFFLQRRSQVPDSFDDARAKKWTFKEMAIIQRRWRHNLKTKFIDEHPERRPWDYGEPIKEEEWNRFLERNASEEARVKVSFLIFN